MLKVQPHDIQTLCKSRMYFGFWNDIGISNYMTVICTSGGFRGDRAGSAPPLWATD